MASNDDLQACPQCLGTGDIEAGYPCLLCDGEGVVTTDIATAFQEMIVDLIDAEG